MKISVYTIAAETFVPMLRVLSNILDKGAAYAISKGVDSAVLVNGRLAPDMYPLATQVQLACDHARNSTAQLTGQNPPSVENKEQTLEELKGRIEKTIEYVQSAPASAFEGAEDREIRIPVPGNDAVIEMNGIQFLKDWAIPHFYFHVVTAYDILRHNGVEIGKLDFLSHVGAYVRPQGKSSVRKSGG